MSAELPSCSCATPGLPATFDVMLGLREAIKKSLPGFILRPIKRYRARRGYEQAYGQLSTRQAFAKIYREGVWGGSLYSGSGSHVDKLTVPYLEACRQALQQMEVELGHKPDAVDLGCGDFTIGSQLRPYCRDYTGCDVVEQVVLANRPRFDSVKFSQVDITEDPLPQADVVFIRQVLQHLSNDCIQRVLPKLAQYKYLVLTEHLPGGEFTPNVDKVTGPHIRLLSKSGVVLTEAPFHLKCQSRTRLCDVRRESDDSILRTELYEI